MASTAQSCKSGSCSGNEFDLARNLTLILTMSNDDSISIHYNTGLRRGQLRVESKDVPNHGDAYPEPVPETSTCALRVSYPAPETDRDFDHGNAVRESDEKHVWREVVPTNGEIREDPLECVAADSSESAPNVR
jgi:hypothetical protein